MNPYYLPQSKELVLKVAAGNPGALEVTRQLQWFTKWLEILCWLANHGKVGSKLWELYKDEHNQDIHSLGQWIENKIHQEKQSKFNLQVLTGLSF
jgi:hypothetical protein